MEQSKVQILKKLRKWLTYLIVLLLISGGVSSIDDIKKAKGLKNIEGIIVGKAIYDGDINLEELVKEIDA